MTERSTVEILRAARKRISSPERWTKGKLARERAGRSVPTWDESACMWCVVGSVWREGGAALGPAHPALRALFAAVWELFPLRTSGPDWPVSAFDDHPETTHGDLLAAFDKAISLAEEASC